MALKKMAQEPKCHLRNEYHQLQENPGDYRNRTKKNRRNVYRHLESRHRKVTQTEGASFPYSTQMLRVYFRTIIEKQTLNAISQKSKKKVCVNTYCSPLVTRLYVYPLY